jgi:hypothetical protein
MEFGCSELVHPHYVAEAYAWRDGLVLVWLTGEAPAEMISLLAVPIRGLESSRTFPECHADVADANQNRHHPSEASPLQLSQGTLQ